MKTVNEMKQSERYWEEKLEDVAWVPGGVLDCGKKTSRTPELTDTDVLVTMDDLHFYPTQEMLKTYTFYAEQDVFDKLFKPYYHVRQLKKEKAEWKEKAVISVPILLSYIIVYYIYQVRGRHNRVMAHYRGSIYDSPPTLWFVFFAWMIIPNILLLLFIHFVE